MLFKKKKKTLDYLVNINCNYGYKIRYSSSITSDYQIIPIIKKGLVHMVNTYQWKEIIKDYKIKIEKLPISDTCSICYQNSNFVTNCNHNYEFTNLMKWYIKKKNCPLCKTEISLEQCKIDRNSYINL